MTVFSWLTSHEETFRVILHSTELSLSLKKQELSLSLYRITALCNNTLVEHHGLLAFYQSCLLPANWLRPENATCTHRYTSAAILTSPVQWPNPRPTCNLKNRAVGPAETVHCGVIHSLLLQTFSIRNPEIHPTGFFFRRTNCFPDRPWGPPSMYNVILVKCGPV